MTNSSRRRAPAPPPLAATSAGTSDDPLLKLLQRYEAEREAFDAEGGTEQLADRDWDRIAEETWSRTQNEILEHQPPATSGAGAFFALDHVLRADCLFGEREECADQQMLWLLIKAARDYIATIEFLDTKK